MYRGQSTRARLHILLTSLSSVNILIPCRSSSLVNLRPRNLRANVPKNQTFSKYSGNTQKINFAHILRFGRSLFETNHDILRLAEYRFINEKIDNNRIPSKSRFWSSKFKTNLEASCHKIKQPTSIKTIGS